MLTPHDNDQEHKKVNMAAYQSLEETSDSLAERVYHQLSEMIMNGDFNYGDPLQERRIAELMNVSRTPVREAIGRLEADGFVERKAGRVTVREVRLQEFVEILHVRKLIECDAAREAAKNVDAKDLQRVRTEIEKLLENRVTSAKELRAVDDMFHNMIAEASKNKLIVELVTDLRRRTAMFDHDRMPTRFLPGNREHLDIIDALEKRDGTLASARMARHINNVHKSIFEKWNL